MIDCQWVLKNFQWRNACNIEVIQSAESIFLNSDYKSSFESFSKSLDRLNNKAASVCCKIKSDIYYCMWYLWYFHKSYPTVVVDMKLRCCCCCMKLLWWMLWTVPSLVAGSCMNVVDGGRSGHTQAQIHHSPPLAGTSSETQYTVLPYGQLRQTSDNGNICCIYLK